MARYPIDQTAFKMLFLLDAAEKTQLVDRDDESKGREQSMTASGEPVFTLTVAGVFEAGDITGREMYMVKLNGEANGKHAKSLIGQPVALKGWSINEYSFRGGDGQAIEGISNSCASISAAHPAQAGKPQSAHQG